MKEIVKKKEKERVSEKERISASYVAEPSLDRHRRRFSNGIRNFISSLTGIYFSHIARIKMTRAACGSSK